MTTELTDAALEAAVARAMGWVRVTASGLDYWTDGERGVSAKDWHPLERDANGQPTERAAAQLWGVMEWLVRQTTAVSLLDGPEGFIAQLDGPVNEQHVATLARAVCEAAAVLGKEAT